MTEVIVAVAIIIALAMLILPVSTRLTEKSRGIKCMGNLRQIGVLFGSYLVDHKMRTPNAYEYYYNEAGTRLIRVWYQHLWPYAGPGTKPNDFPAFLCPKGNTYSYAFERTASNRPIHEVQQNLSATGVQVDGRRWLLVDSIWYFLDRAHGIDGDAGTRKATAFRHNERANFLLPDFSVLSLNRVEANQTMYIYKQFPIPSTSQ